MGLLQAVNERSSLIPLNFNTGTLLDYGVGSYKKSFDDKHWILDGGLSFTNSWAGRFQRFKTTIAVSMIVKAMERYPDSVFIVFDSELSNRDRWHMADMSDMYRDDPIKRKAHLQDIHDRIIIYNITEFKTLDDFHEKLKDTYYKEINDHRKDYLRETPFKDPVNHKKARQTLVPTFVMIDSLSEAMTRNAYETVTEREISDSKQQTVAMRDGAGKNKFLTQLVYDAAAYGAVFVATAQVGDAIDMSGRNLPRQKDIQFMKQDDQIKGTGRKFNFLMSASYINESARLLQDSNKECQFPYIKGKTKPTDISEVSMVIVRDKTKGAGDKIYPVLSQSRGYDTTLSNYNLLKQYGLPSITDKTKPHWGTVFNPENKVTRITLASKGGEDLKFFRALEIIAQLTYFQKNWNLGRFSKLPTDISPEMLAEKLAKSTYAIDDILASRSWWSYGFKEIPYLSLLDLLEIVHKVS